MICTLRPWLESDLDSLIYNGNNENVAQFMTDAFPSPFTQEAGKKFIERVSQSHLPNILAIEFEGKAIGGIGIHPQDGVFCLNAELGYWIGEDYWGRGIMSEAVRQMVVYGFNNFSIDRIFARPFSNNIGSQKVLERCNFDLEVRISNSILKKGQKLDELIYAIRRS